VGQNATAYVLPVKPHIHVQTTTLIPRAPNTLILKFLLCYLPGVIRLEMFSKKEEVLLKMLRKINRGFKLKEQYVAEIFNS
jgi:hypothetical protein